MKDAKHAAKSDLTAVCLHSFVRRLRRTFLNAIGAVRSQWIRLLASLVMAFARIVGTARRLGLPAPPRDCVLILPPWSPGSLGDEASEAALASGLRTRGFARLGVISYAPSDNWQHLRLSPCGMNMHEHFHMPSAKERYRAIAELRPYGRLAVLGADVMDGAHNENGTLDRLSLVSLAATAGLETSIVSFSFNAQPAPSAVAALRSLPRTVRLVARDPVSHERLVRGLNRPVELGADVAFLLEPSFGTETVRSLHVWTESERDQGQAILGVNLSSHLIRFVPELTADRLVGCIRETLSGFASQAQSSFILIPHSFDEDDLDDQTLALALFEALPAGIRAHCRVVPRCSAAEIKAVCGFLDLALSSRMHVAIACLGQGTPVLSMVYQGKFEGLYQHFGLEGCTLEPSAAMNPEHLEVFLTGAFRKREALRDRILAELPRIRALAERNFGPASSTARKS